MRPIPVRALDSRPVDSRHRREIKMPAGGKVMAKVTVNIPFVIWRDGKPRFVPGPKMRAEGWKGEDLKAGGRWMTLDEAAAWVRAREAEIARRRDELARKAKTGRKAPAAAIAATPKDDTLPGLLELYLTSPATADMAAVTKRDYRGKMRVLTAFDPDVASAPVKSFTRAILYGLWENLAREKSISMAKAIMAVISTTLSYASLKARIDANPAYRLKMTTPGVRLRVGSKDEMDRLVDAADAIGRPEIGDAIILGIWTGQRQADRLALQRPKRTGDRLIFRQMKTGALVDVPAASYVTARFANARLRRDEISRRPDAGGRHKAVETLVAVIDEKANRPFAADWYRKCFSEVRDAAVAGVPADGYHRPGRKAEGANKREADRDVAAHWKVPPCPSLDDFRDQDLRDTAVTWLARAGCTIPEICAVTGHSIRSATQVLKHYLATDAGMADTALAKMTAWYQAEG